MSAPFHFVVSLRSFLIWEARLPLYVVKNCLNISTIFINYQQRVIAVYINYGSRSSKTLGSESEIMRGMAKFGKPTKKKRRSHAPPALFLSFRSRFFFFSRPLCRRSPPSRSLEQASKTLKNKLSPRCAFMDMKYLLCQVPVTLISPINKCNFLSLPWKSPASVTKVPAVAGSRLLFWTLSSIDPQTYI